MPTLKEYNGKLARLRTTRKMTRTMKMVSTTKLRRAQEAYKRVEDFRRRLASLLARVGAPGSGEPAQALLENRAARRVLAVVITSDRGLCGGFNSGVNRAVAQWMAENRHRWERLQLSFCGRRGFLFFRDTADILTNYEGLSARPVYGDVRRLAHNLQADFMAGAFDEVYLAYTATLAGASARPVIERLLPVTIPAVPEAEAGASADWLLEPGRPELLHVLLSKLVAVNLYTALLSSAVAEHRARMMAMDNSTRNAENLIDVCTLLRNRARQAAITRELSEIISGAEALK